MPILHTVPFVSINGTYYTTAKYIELVAQELGSYERYEYDRENGDGHTGPWHPGTVTVQAFKKALKDNVLRKKFGISNKNHCKLEVGTNEQNDKIFAYMKQQGLCTDYDLDVHRTSLNVFDEVAVDAIVAVLNKDVELKVSAERKEKLPKLIAGGVLTPVLIQPEEKRVKKSLFDILKKKGGS